MSVILRLLIFYFFIVVEVERFIVLVSYGLGVFFVSLVMAFLLLVLKFYVSVCFLELRLKLVR